MSEQKPEWWDWIDLDKPVDEPMRLRKEAPEDVKEKFEEWQKKKAEERAKGIWR